MTDSILLLTPREKEVLHLLSKGMTYKEISGQIEVTPETVKKHLKNVYRKLKAKNKVEALNKVRLL
jgi:two-component system, NarL family, response regulator LiaR